MAEALLELDGVTVRRGMGVVLNNFSLTVKSGECVILHGENGAGKSTVIETAARLLPMESGTVKHHEKIVCDGDGRRINPPKPFGLTLQSNCLVQSQTIEQRFQDVVSLSGKSFDSKPLLEDYKISNRRNDKIAHLSGGQMRKVAVLSGLIPGMVSAEPRIILLDEPDSGLDETSVEMLVSHLHMLRNLGHAIVIASHNKRLYECATTLHDLSSTQSNRPENADTWTVNSKDKKYSLINTKIGWKLNFNTLVSLQRNWLAALLVMGTLLSIADPLTLTDEEIILMGFTLAPAFTMGLIGDSVFKILAEHRAIDWWRSQHNTVPHSYAESALSGMLITAIAMQIFLQSVDLRIIVVGGLITLLTSIAVRFLQMSTIRLARSNAVFIRLLTPILILPWGIVVDYCATL